MIKAAFVLFKTTIALNYVLNAKVKCRLIFNKIHENGMYFRVFYEYAH